LFKKHPAWDDTKIYEIPAWKQMKFYNGGGITYDAINKEGKILTWDIPAIIANPEVLLHEFIHVITLDVLYKEEDGETLTTEEKEFVEELEFIFEQAKSNTALMKIVSDTPSELDIREFVANVVDANFIKLASKQNLLPSVKYIFKKIADAVLKLFGIQEDTITIYDATYASLEKYIQYSLKTFETTNEIKSHPLDEMLTKLSIDSDMANSLKIQYDEGSDFEKETLEEELKAMIGGKSFGLTDDLVKQEFYKKSCK
jgi:hypothetical protein